MALPEFSNEMKTIMQQNINPAPLFTKHKNMKNMKNENRNVMITANPTKKWGGVLNFYAKSLPENKINVIL